MKPKLIVWANQTTNLNPIIGEVTKQVKLSVKEITITKIETNPNNTTLNLISEELQDGKQVRYVVSVDAIGDFGNVKVGDKIKIGFREDVVNVPAAGLKRTITYYEVLELVTDPPPPPTPPTPKPDTYELPPRLDLLAWLQGLEYGTPKTTLKLLPHIPTYFEMLHRDYHFKPKEKKPKLHSRSWWNGFIMGYLQKA